jgi:hypothetical protein
METPVHSLAVSREVTFVDDQQTEHGDLPRDTLKGHHAIRRILVGWRVVALLLPKTAIRPSSFAQRRWQPLVVGNSLRRCGVKKIYRIMWQVVVGLQKE